MTWPLAKFAARLVRLVSAHPARVRSVNTIGARGHAVTITSKSKPHGLSTSALWRRGLRLNNRDNAKALQYVLRHQSLSKERFSNGV
jgi:hypothetical protein